MKKLLRVCVAVGLALGVFLLVGCGDDKGVGPNVGTTGGGTPSTGGGDQTLTGEWKLLKESSTGQSLVGTSWKLTIVNDAGWPMAWETEGYGEKKFSLTFKEDGTFNTFSSINEFGGTYAEESRGGDLIYKINIANFYGTKVGGDTDGSDDLWRHSFPTIDRFSLVDGVVLKLYYDGGKNYLEFAPFPGSNTTGDVRPDAVPVSYKKYSLEESPCEWKEDRFAVKSNGAVVVINNNEALENYVGCIDGTYPAVDFSQKTLLVATGVEVNQSTPRIATLVKNPDGAYAMEVSMNVSDAPAPNFWQVSVVVDKIDDNSHISVAVQRDGTGDPIVNCGSDDGLFKKNCGGGVGPFGQRSGDSDTVTVVSGR